MISNVLAFTPITGNQCCSSLGLRTETRIIKRSYKNSNSGSRSMTDQYERGFSRNLALPMATKLKFADDENGMTNTTVELSSRVETLFPSTETLTIEMAEHVPLGCTVDESLHEDDDFIFISKLTINGHAEEAGLQVGDVIVGVTGLFGELVSTIDTDIEKL
jgi:C-terminal processing protease CtpA/Prc